MVFILHNRSRISYNRWWEGGTLLQKTRGEWFNAYSSIVAFTSTKPELQDQVDAYLQFLARMMSLLMCCGLQQVSSNRDRPFEIFDLHGMQPSNLEFLNSAPDKVEIIMQWIQRSVILQQQTGVLPVAPPILSRAFQEISRGIVNLQNARKIADFPYPYPLAQASIILLMLHWVATPIVTALALPREWAAIFAFFTIMALWCLHFNALDLEFPFGDRANDLPMEDFQREWNNSIRTLIDKRATGPPLFEYDPATHDSFRLVMSDGSDLCVREPRRSERKIAVISSGINGKPCRMEMPDSAMESPAESFQAVDIHDLSPEGSALSKLSNVTVPPELQIPWKTSPGTPGLEVEANSASGFEHYSVKETTMSTSPTRSSQLSRSEPTVKLTSGKESGQLQLPVEVLAFRVSASKLCETNSLQTYASEKPCHSI